MFKKTSKEIPPGKVSTVIGEDAIFKGSIETKSFIRIDGEMEGDISTQGDVVIGERGKVKLALKARNVTIAGRFDGSLEAEGKLEIRGSGVILGSVKANGLIVDDGAQFSGEMEMSGPGEAAAPSKIDKAAPGSVPGGKGKVSC